MLKHLKTIASLTVICAVMALLLAVTNYLTYPIIEKNENAAANEALLVVMPEGKDFKTVDISTYTLPATIKEVHSESGGGYVFKIETAGYSGGLIIMCGVNKDGAVTGATCLASSETLGYEKTYGENMKDQTLETIDSVDTISGATKTTEGYKGAIKDALNAFVIIGGGEVDLRSPEEILKDNLSAALPSANGEFEELFISVSLSSNADAVYKAINDSGYVLVIGEEFVSIDANGNRVSEVGADIEATVKDDISKITAQTKTEIDLSGYAEMPSNVVKAYKTSDGAYILDLKASGFGINGDKWYNPSGEYIYITVSISSSGEIINCKTVSQKETDGIGSACADKEFYSQFNGKTQETYKDIDAINGATITTNGYKTAILRAFEAVTLLKGGAN